MKTTMNGLDVEYRDVGRGLSVFLLSNEEPESRYWQDQSDALVEKGFRVVTICLTEQQRINVVPILMNYLGVGRAVVVGLTGAASLIDEIRNAYPERVAATCLISPSTVSGGALSRISCRYGDMPEHVLIGGQDSLAAHMVNHAIPLSKQSAPLALCRNAACPGSSTDVVLQLTGFLKQLNALRPRHSKRLNWIGPDASVAMKVS